MTNQHGICFLHCGWGVICYQCSIFPLQTGRYGNWLSWLCGCTISQSVRGAQMVDPYSSLRRMRSGAYHDHCHGFSTLVLFWCYLSLELTRHLRWTFEAWPLFPLLVTPQCHAQIADVVLGLLLGTPWASGSGSCPLCSSPVWRWED